jgi:predicted nucleic acid-binding Zn ribbon protein
MRQCNNCGKRIPDNLTFCSQECAKQMKEKFSKAFPISAQILEEQKTQTKKPNLNESNLKAICDFLDLNEAKDGRLIVKADLMKKIIYLLSKWKTGNKRELIDKLSIYTCISTRKIREDYLQPLITMGILVEYNYTLRFQGLPK